MGGQAPTRDLVTQATNLRHLVVQELLSAETGFDGHDQHHVELVEDVENRFDRLGGTHGEACLAAHVTQLAGQTHRRVGGAHMERDGGGTELRVFRGPTVGVLDHQVHVDRQVGDLADALDDGLAKGEVRHEVVVHHVDMHEVGVGDGLEVAFEVAEISGKDAGCDLYAHGSHSMVEERRDGLRLHDVLVCVLWYCGFL